MLHNRLNKAVNFTVASVRDVSTVATVDVSFHSVFIQFDNKKCQNVTPETPRI